MLSKLAGKLVLVFLVGFCVFSWGSNFVKLSECDFEAPYKCETIRAIGIIPPIGIITGTMNFEFDGK